MFEVDNREARRIELVLSIVVLATYGVMSADVEILQDTSIQLCYVEPMIRRLRLHDHRRQCEPKNLETDATDTTGQLMMYIFLLDTVRGIHFNTKTLFGTSELFIPFSNYKLQFQAVYSKLVAEVPQLPKGLTQSDGSFLLVALTADLFLVKQALQGIVPEERGSPIILTIPFSPAGEQRRMFKLISKGLDCWCTMFIDSVDSHTLALYNFCRLLHAFPQVCDLPKLAGYPSASTSPATEADHTPVLEASEKAVDYAWQILENINSNPTQGSLAPIWLPVVTFLAALAIWSRLQSGNYRAKSGMGSL